MAWTQEQLDALNQAIAAGTLSVRYQDRTVQYRSLDEMLRLRRTMMDELGVVSERRLTRNILKYSKGIEG